MQITIDQFHLETAAVAIPLHGKRPLLRSEERSSGHFGLRKDSGSTATLTPHPELSCSPKSFTETCGELSKGRASRRTSNGSGGGDVTFDVAYRDDAVSARSFRCKKLP
ncbi:MAG: hypothetical protein WAV72_25470, partial [Bradyrhizobium sp.]